ncbi:hypothetical protein [Armatimonas sp.]|uniref:hypothetical protein n=1 Tax=Armatimonas sp. TaxID=1872638 RepID=UPI003753B106
MSASTSKNQGATSAAHRLQPRTQGGKFAPKTVPLVYKTDTMQAAIEISQNPEALRLAGELATKCAEATKLRGECNVLQNTLGESRKISQEREKQLKDSLQRLTEEQRLHGLSRMSDANARGSLSQLHAELGGDPDQPALEKVQRLTRDLNAIQEALTESERECRELAKSFGTMERNNGELAEKCDETIVALTLANGAVGLLEAQLRDLTPRLPLWVRAIAITVGLLCVAFVAHRAGFSAAIALQGGAR